MIILYKYFNKNIFNKWEHDLLVCSVRSDWSRNSKLGIGNSWNHVLRNISSQNYRLYFNYLDHNSLCSGNSKRCFGPSISSLGLKITLFSSVIGCRLAFGNRFAPGSGSARPMVAWTVRSKSVVVSLEKERVEFNT